MSKKTFTEAPRPSLRPTTEQISAYERGGSGTDHRPNRDKESRQRFSLDLPVSLHRRFKAACAASGRRMSHELQALVEVRTSEMENEMRSRGDTTH